MYKILLVFAIIFSVMASSACSIATPATYHISSVHPTNTDGIVKLVIRETDGSLNDNYNDTSVFYSLDNNVIYEEAEYQVNESLIEVLDKQNYEGDLNGSVFSIKQDSVTVFQRIIPENITSDVSFAFFIDLELNRVFLSVFNYEFRYNAIHSFNDSSFEKILTNNMFNGYMVLGSEELNMFYDVYGGAMCVEGAYYSYTSDDIRYISNKNTGDRSYINSEDGTLVINRLMDWETNTSRIDRYYLLDGTHSSHSFEADNLAEYFRDVETEIFEINYNSTITPFVLIFAVSILKRKRLFAFR